MGWVAWREEKVDAYWQAKEQRLADRWTSVDVARVRRLAERGDVGGLLGQVGAAARWGQPEVREALRQLGRQAVPALIGAARGHPSTGARLDTIVVLRELGDRRALPVLLALADQDPDSLLDGERYRVWHASIAALAALDPDAAWPILLRALDAEDEETQSAAVALIVDHGGARAVEALLDRLARFDPERYQTQWIAMVVADGLAQLGDRRAVGPLVAYIEQTPDRAGMRQPFLRALAALDSAEVRRLAKRGAR